MVSEQIDELKAQTVKYASVGTSHSVCLTEAGELFSWGDNLHGQLGRGQLEPNMIFLHNSLNIYSLSYPLMITCYFS
jgi:alpha-tubulin suppressor-like RCC1 family protein